MRPPNPSIHATRPIPGEDGSPARILHATLHIVALFVPLGARCDGYHLNLRRALCRAFHVGNQQNIIKLRAVCDPDPLDSYLASSHPTASPSFEADFGGNADRATPAFWADDASGRVLEESHSAVWSETSSKQQEEVRRRVQFERWAEEDEEDDRSLNARPALEGPAPPPQGQVLWESNFSTNEDGRCFFASTREVRACAHARSGGPDLPSKVRQDGPNRMEGNLTSGPRF